MDFDEALQYLLSLGHETLTIKLGLRNTELLLHSLRNPEQAFPAVQIAGTNGKGSTAVVFDSICGKANIKTGLYTSPHLQSINERIKIAGVELSREDFARYATEVRNAANDLLHTGQIDALPTFFEQVTAIALVAFREAGIELAILETGLGGRLDSTTAARAEVCAITQIAFDHEEYLGHTIESIASEKAAIIRPGTRVVVANQRPEALRVIMKRCEENEVLPLLNGCVSTVEEVSPDGRFRVTFATPTDRYENVWLGLRGRHQIENVALAIQLAEILRSTGFGLPHAAIIKGIETASHPGRLELIGRNPRFLLDGAHNPAGAGALREFLDHFAPRPLTIVFAAMADKRIEEIAEILFPIADNLVLTAIENPRAASTEMMQSIAKRFAKGRILTCARSDEALKVARAQTEPNGMICITGSLYLIGEIHDQVIDRSTSVNA
ncbi:MAG TPA: folylpolyglutamate synthase/dihydrofolate synthase family protein [Pyrinomonadaceae bacterium]|jgi:dihydrofolate synthase/folylpolyglutamate synthase|nr:folylpolyglutamate synthase/dihydrofolate synthase family protein [Pyrinomonadaceae bacterium]